VLSQYNFELKESEYNFAKGKHHGFSIPIFESTINHIEKDWKKLMKQWHGKVDGKKHEYFTDNASLKAIGENVFDTYAYCKKGSDNIEFIVAVDLGGAFLNDKQHSSKAKAFKKELISFAKESSKNGLDIKIKEQTEKEQQFSKQLDHLIKQQEKLTENIESWKAEIEKAENEILNNNKEQEAKKNEVDEQSQVLEQLKNKKTLIK
jgi:hypothetical protein